MAEFPDPDERLVLAPGCDRCPDRCDSRTRIAWGNGPLDADAVVVGEAPAAGDPDETAAPWHGGNHTGMAYTSRHSGRRIRDLLASADYPDAFYTNAVKCFPADPADPTTSREPTAAERATCRGHLLTELERVDPAVVVPTGRHATASAFAAAGLELDGFLDAVLEPRALPGLEVTAVPLLHPSYRDVWRPRLGYETAAAYRDAVADALDEAVG